MTDQSDMNHAPRTPQRRRALLHGVVGVPAPWSEAVAKTLTGVALRDWDDEVAPLIARHWPEAKAAGLVERLRGEACHLHAPRAFLALLVSAHRPPVLQAVALLERVPAARVKEYARAARVGFGLLRRAAMRDQSRRTTLAAALVAVLGVGHDADADLASLLDLSWRPDRGPLRVARELLIKLESGLSLGAHGAVTALGAALPQVGVALHRAVRRGDHETARGVHECLLRLWNSLPVGRLAACIDYMQSCQGLLASGSDNASGALSDRLKSGIDRELDPMLAMLGHVRTAA